MQLRKRGSEKPPANRLPRIEETEDDVLPQLYTETVDVIGGVSSTAPFPVPGNSRQLSLANEDPEQQVGSPSPPAASIEVGKRACFMSSDLRKVSESVVAGLRGSSESLQSDTVPRAVSPLHEAEPHREGQRIVSVVIFAVFISQILDRHFENATSTRGLEGSNFQEPLTKSNLSTTAHAASEPTDVKTLSEEPILDPLESLTLVRPLQHSFPTSHPYVGLGAGDRPLLR